MGKKRGYKKKRVYKKKGKMTMFKNIVNKVYPYKIRVKRIKIESAFATETQGTLNFRLSNLDSVADFGGLYDQYKIVKVQVKFIPIGADMIVLQPTTNSAPTVQTPLLYSAIDYDQLDTQTPKTIEEIRQYQGCKAIKASRTTSWTITPKLRGAVVKSIDGGGVPTFAYTTVPNRWLDKADNGVPYCGIVFGLEKSGTITAQNKNFAMTIEAVYWLQFKGVR